MPLVSIMIPTNRPAGVLVPCLRALAAQTFPPGELEVVVVYNGCNGTAPPDLTPDNWPFALHVATLPEVNVAAARSAALDRARGQWLFFLNDDVVPGPDFIAAHLAAHGQLDQPAAVLGLAAWRHYDDETVFDRLVQTTSLVFFYDQMRPHTWYNFRHAWTLNLSLSRCSLGTMRFDERLGPFFYEDLELAFRLERACGLRIWYEPRAVALHDHRYTLAGYLEREFEMGRAAVRLWHANPDCYRAIYGELDDAAVTYFRRYSELEGRRADELRAGLGALAARRMTELSPAPAVQQELIAALYAAHLPLKRLAFRRGLLAALAPERAGGQVAPTPRCRLAASAAATARA